ncbi:hypothetical protein WA026_011594 [Henosepilachna vigintioctopunctata]|uniref:TIR domain-containing protein n=1 Tax=Henosepilachna vigintioctopunctata TaxID=420089 RepID=A0AAW1TSN3_9CUCU
MIDSIDQLLFKNMENLVEINLNYNRIVALDPNSLGYKPSLTTFSMSHNGFDFGSHKNIFLSVKSTPNLKRVDLSWNNISRYPNDLNGILTIESVNMGHNVIKAIKVSSVITKKVSDNIDVVINLDSNKISSIQVNSDELPITRNWRTVVTIRNNPIICDCHALSLAKFLQEDHNLDSCIQFEPKEVQCSGSMAGKILNDIKPSDLTCLTNSNCTSNRDCACLSRSYDDSLIVNCSKRGLTDIPELISDESSKYDQIIVHLDGNNLKRSPGEYDGFGNVTELYLQKNKISNVTWLPTSLKVLNLSENALSYINLGVLKLLNESKIGNLSLGSNTWNCDCKASSFAEYLRSHIKQIDSWDIKCNNTDKKLVNLNKKDLCPTNLELTLTLALPILFILLLIAVAATLYFKYKKEILIWLYSNGLFLFLFEEDEIDEDKIYDAFISYSHKDEDFVTDNIISTLESGEQPYKLCIHVRDFIPGELIHTQILNSVKSSRRTIVILSTSFLESVWGKLEFKTAHTEAMLEEELE